MLCSICFTQFHDVSLLASLESDPPLADISFTLFWARSQLFSAWRMCVVSLNLVQGMLWSEIPETTRKGTRTVYKNPANKAMSKCSARDCCRSPEAQLSNGMGGSHIGMGLH